VRQSRLQGRKKSLSKRDVSELLASDSPSIKRKYESARTHACSLVESTHGCCVFVSQGNQQRPSGTVDPGLVGKHHSQVRIIKGL
jgi:hypothetical protein